MSGEQIVVREITSPQPGKKQYSLIDTAGRRWGVMPENIGEYTVGGIYEVVDSKSSVFNGKTYITLNQANFLGMEDGSIPLPGGGPRQAAPPPPAPRPAAPRYTPRAPAPRFTPQARAVPDNKDLQIFICGALNNALANQNVHPLDLTAPEIIGFIERLMTAHRQTLGKSGGNNDLNDEIPDFDQRRQ